MTRRAGLLGWGLVAAGGAALLLYSRRARASVVTPPAPRGDLGRGDQLPQPAVTDDLEALARVIASEVGRGTDAERAAVGWTVRNRARRRGISIARLVCHPACGPQWEAEGKLRPFSSARAASDAERRMAAGILTAWEAPTRGAIAFIEPALQDQLAAEKRLGHRPYREVHERWIADGMKPIG